MDAGGSGNIPGRSSAGSLVSLLSSTRSIASYWGSSDSIDKSWGREIFHWMKASKMEEYFVYPQGVCRIRKPAFAGNGCAIFPILDAAQPEEKIRTQPQAIDSEFPPQIK